MKDLVSVVIPVYNAEEYIEACINSVVNQTYYNVEIILVNDGSTDNSGMICDEYAKTETRIRVIHKKNGGVSSARNIGIEAAKGKYLCFIDSDDRIPENSIESLYDAITLSNSQFVAGICLLDNSNKAKNGHKSNKTIDIKDEPLELLEYLSSPGSYSPYAKIYDTAIFKQYDVRYDTELKCSEDALMIRQFMRYCSQISLITDKVYYYNTQNEKSLSHKRYPEYSLYYKKKMVALDELLSDLQISIEEKNCFLTERAIHGLWISICHYCSHWKKVNEREFFINNAIELLSPWLYLSMPRSKFYLAMWWGNAVEALNKNDSKSFIELSVKKYNSIDILFKIKRGVSKLLKMV